MDWLKPFLPLLQTGIKVYLSGKLIQKTSENAKGLALRSSVIAFGSMTFLTFLLTSIIMVFVDLGSQFETHNGVHFSGMMLSGIYLTTLGLVIFGVCFAIAKYLSVQEQQAKAVAKSEIHPYAALILFAEELMKQLIQNLNQPKSSKSSE